MTNPPKRTKQISAEQMDEILGLDVRSGVSRQVKGSRQIDRNWKADGIEKLREWILASNQPSVTAETWAAVYIRCGRCLTEWRAWCEANPITDLAAWIDAASEVVAAKRWI